MKIAITITLVVLSICCSSASSDTCPGFFQVLEFLFMGSESSYKAALQFYSPGSELQAAGLQLKKLVDTLPQKTRTDIMKLSEKILTSPLCDQGLSV
ncbi:uteroglobin [Sigmodon hispidus]